MSSSCIWMSAFILPGNEICTDIEIDLVEVSAWLEDNVHIVEARYLVRHILST